MAMHDTFVGMGYGWSWRARWPGTRQRNDRQPPGPGGPVRAPYRRKLAKIERTLMAETPALSSKFALFNHLTSGELPVGVEQLASSARRRPAAAYVAVLLALAAVVTMCVALSAQVRTAVRPCQPAAATGTTVHALPREATCDAYANTKQ
ncbi:MAG: hypothetical protein ACRDNO_20165 [Trebonia sp.]